MSFDVIRVSRFKLNVFIVRVMDERFYYYQVFQVLTISGIILLNFSN